MKEVIPALRMSAILSAFGLLGVVMNSDRIILGVLFSIIAVLCTAVLIVQRREELRRQEIDEWEASAERIEQKQRFEAQVQRARDEIDGRRPGSKLH